MEEAFSISFRDYASGCLYLQSDLLSGYKGEF